MTLLTSYSHSYIPYALNSRFHLEDDDALQHEEVTVELPRILEFLLFRSSSKFERIELKITSSTLSSLHALQQFFLVLKSNPNMFILIELTEVASQHEKYLGFLNQEGNRLCNQNRILKSTIQTCNIVVTRLQVPIRREN